MALRPFHTSVYTTNVMNNDIFSLNSVLTKGRNLILAELDNALEWNAPVLLTRDLSESSSTEKDPLDNCLSWEIFT